MSNKFNEKEVTKALEGITNFEEMRAILHNQGEKDGVRMAYDWDSNPIEPVNTAKFSRDSDPMRDPDTGRFVSQQPTAEPRVFSKTETIAGKPMEFSAESPEQLDVLVSQAHIVAEALQTPLAQTSVVNQTTKQLNDFDCVELDLKFRRGEISTQDYLEQSGEIDSYLQRKGVPLEELKSTVAEAQQMRDTQLWADATQTFLANSDWIGGQRNLATIQNLILSRHLENEPDKVQILESLWEEMKRTGMVFDTPERQAAEAAERQAAVNQKVADELAQASPQEIIEAYRTATIAAVGENAVGTAFRETYRRGRLDSSGIFNN
jgi:hypothetical protein